MFLNQIFYNCNKFDQIVSLDKLEKFMLNINNLQTLKTTKESQEFVVETESLRRENHNLGGETTKELKEFEGEVESQTYPIRENHNLGGESKTQEFAIKPFIKKNDIYYPNKEDSLFWCIFISFYGWKEYEFIGKKYANRELEEKQKIMENIKKTPAPMKQMNYKVTNVLIQEILSDLLLNKKTSLPTFLAFVSYYKKRVIIVRKNTYLLYTYDNTGLYRRGGVADERVLASSSTPPNLTTNSCVFDFRVSRIGYVCDSSSPTNPNDILDNDMDFIIIHYNVETGRYGIDMNYNQEKVKDIIENNFVLSSISKPLKGASTYKVSELEEIAQKLKLDYISAIKKNDLYNLIYDSCLWV